MGSGNFRLGAGGKIALAVLAVAVILNFWLLYRIDGRLSRMDVQHRARTAIANVYGPNQFDALSKLCPPAGNNSPLCKALAGHSYRNLGNHDNLWVFLDAALQVSRAKLTPEQRQRMERLLVDLSSAISAGGAWKAEQVPGSEADGLVATDLYWPIVAQAVACDSVPDLGCTGGLPAGVSAALSRLARFVVDVGPTVAAYEMSFRMEAVRNLMKNGLLKT